MRGQKAGRKIHLEGKPVRIISASLSDKVLDALERYTDREGISRSWAAGKLIAQALGLEGKSAK